MNQLPAPLIDADVDLRDFQYMPLDVVRLRDSDLASLEEPEACWAAVLLWCASWHQIPAGSIPDDDRVLARLAGYGRVVKEWTRVRGGALRGWIKCSDGRLYHPVVTEKAKESWESKMRHAYARLAERMRKSNKDRKEKALPALEIPTYNQWNQAGRPPEFANLPPETAVFPPEATSDSGGTTASSEPSSAGIPPENALKGKGKGEGEGTEGMLTPTVSSLRSEPSGVTPCAAPSAAPPGKVTALSADTQAACRATWEAYATAYLDRYRAEPVRNAKTNKQVVELVKRLGMVESPHVAAFFIGHQDAFYVRKGHDFGLLLQDAEKLRTEWATGQKITATIAKQADRAGTTGSLVASIIAERSVRA